jgi:hypothetical protein
MQKAQIGRNGKHFRFNNLIYCPFLIITCEYSLIKICKTPDSLRRYSGCSTLVQSINAEPTSSGTSDITFTGCKRYEPSITIFVCTVILFAQQNNSLNTTQMNTDTFRHCYQISKNKKQKNIASLYAKEDSK